MNEMYKLMACWKSNGFIDTHCQEEINLFLDCASNQVFLMTLGFKNDNLLCKPFKLVFIVVWEFSIFFWHLIFGFQIWFRCGFPFFVCGYHFLFDLSSTDLK